MARRGCLFCGWRKSTNDHRSRTWQHNIPEISDIVAVGSKGRQNAQYSVQRSLLRMTDVRHGSRKRSIANASRARHTGGANINGVALSILAGATSGW